MSILKKIKNFILRKKWLLIIVLLIIAAVFFFIQSSQAKKVEPVFAEVKRKELVQYLEINGVIDAKQKADMFFALGGKVVYLGAKEGDYVRRGQTIATIDQATLNKQLEQSLNNYENQRVAHEYMLDTHEDRVITDEEEVDRYQEQNTLENAVIAVELNSIAIRNSVLSAPFAGVLTVVPQVVPGVQLAATDYFEVVDPNSLILRASIDETDLESVKVGQHALISLDAYDDEPMQSNVSYISFVSRETVTGTVFNIEFPLPVNSLEKYRIGMNADAQIELDRRSNALVVPVEAVRLESGKYLVDLKSDNKDGFEEREITIGLETEDEMEVLSGLNEGDQVLLPE